MNRVRHPARCDSTPPVIAAQRLMMKLLLPIILLSTFLAPLVSRAEGLEPCDVQGTDRYRRKVIETIDGSDRDKVLVSFTAFPSFQPEWGLRIIGSESGPRLRIVSFLESIWYSAYSETEPGYFQQDLSRPSYRRQVRDVALSADTARLIRSVTDREVGEARARKGLQGGFDGTIYVVVADGACGQAWSPDSGSRAGKIIQVFEDLRIQSAIPSRFLQLSWERRIHARLRALEGKRMSATEYLLFAAISLAAIALAALPLFIATAFAAFTPALPRRRLYILSSASVSYGIACIVALPFLLFVVIGAPLSHQLDSDGHAVTGTVVHWLGLAAAPTIGVAWLVAMFMVPALLRRHWRRVFPS